MDFFERLGDTIVSVSRDVTQKAKDVSGIAKLKLDMKAKEDFIKEQYAALGKWYYQEHKEEEGEQKAWIEHIDEALEAIAQMELKILELKKSESLPGMRRAGIRYGGILQRLRCKACRSRKRRCAGSGRCCRRTERRNQRRRSSNALTDCAWHGSLKQVKCGEKEST